MTIISAAAVAASLDLPVNPSLGFAHIVPYKDNKEGRVIAQFQLGWRGFNQLAMRSGQYKTMNVTQVYEGELIKYNRITGDMEFNLEGKTSDVVVGYVAYFKLLNGFEKYWYMTKEEAQKHGKRYSKSYESGQWTKDFDAMAKKTVIKMLLSKFGILSIEMQKAIETDQAVIKEDGTPEYIDSNNSADELGDAQEPVGTESEIPFGEKAE
jgi:recombination protein RecT